MHVWKVGELTDYLAEVLSREQGLQDLWVEGEVAEVTVSNQGHCYLTLKDERSRLACVLFRTELARVPFEVRPGLMLTAHGRAAVYAAAGRLQLILDVAQPSGVGGLYLAFEQLRLKLEAEGLFDPGRKRTPPPFPRRMAVVTSESGAALRDVLRVLRRRSPMVAILLVHSPVQGDIAPRSIERWQTRSRARAATSTRTKPPPPSFIVAIAEWRSKPAPGWRKATRTTPEWGMRWPRQPAAQSARVPTAWTATT